jgi:hypothetical protein
VLEASRVLYADDFERFGYDDAMPGGLDGADRYDEDALTEIGRLVERQERINDLALHAQELSARVRALSTSAAEPVARASRVRRIAWRARRRLARS